MVCYPAAMRPLRYFAGLPGNRQVLWSYLLWYLVMMGYHFSPDPALWVSSLGIAFIVGVALLLSTGPLSLQRLRGRPWESVRLLLIPFLVSSFAATITGRGFVLVFSPVAAENLVALAVIAVFLVGCRLLRWVLPVH